VDLLQQHRVSFQYSSKTQHAGVCHTSLYET
jgi:hypothetical protein